MTYRELRDQINELSDDDLSLDVALYDASTDEVISLEDSNFVTDWYASKDALFVSGILDDGHPFISFNGSGN